MYHNLLIPAVTPVRPANVQSHFWTNPRTPGVQSHTNMAVLSQLHAWKIIAGLVEFQGSQGEAGQKSQICVCCNYLFYIFSIKIETAIRLEAIK